MSASTLVRAPADCHQTPGSGFAAARSVRRRPTAVGSRREHSVEAQRRAPDCGRRTVLSGLARGDDVFELSKGVADLHPRDNTFPGEVFISLAVDALDAAGIERDSPLAYEGLGERHLAECRFRGSDNKKMPFTVLAVGATRGGI